MKVLIVDCYSRNSPRKGDFGRFHKHVTRALRKLRNEDVGEMHIVMKHRTDLDDYLFETNSDFIDPAALKKFDMLDFVFMHGDPNDCPWGRGLRKVAILTKMCFKTEKCLFGSGAIALMLAYMCATGGEIMRVLNDKSTTLKDIETFVPQKALAKNDVFLDRATGDMYEFDEDENCWNPTGNIGFLPHTSNSQRNYGIRKNYARASGRKPQNGLSGELYTSKPGEIQCCVRLHLMNHWSMDRLEARDFIVLCESKWDLDEDVMRTSRTSYNTVIDSSRGPLLIEYKNLMAAHFTISDKYPETRTLLENFVRNKHIKTKIHDRLDMSYNLLMYGDVKSSSSSKAKPKPESNQSASTSSRNDMKKFKNQRASSRKSRPLSASASMSRDLRHRANSTTEKQSTPVSARGRSELDHLRPNKSFDIDELKQLSAVRNTAWSHPTDPSQSSASHSIALSGPEVISHEGSITQEETSSNTMPSFNRSLPTTKKQVRLCRVKGGGLPTPFCNYKRFEKMRVTEEQQAGNGYYSVVNDGPYRTPYEQERLDYQRGKLKWTGGQFRATFGKASAASHPEAGIVNTGPYQAELTVHNIINRRDNPKQFIDQSHRFNVY